MKRLFLWIGCLLLYGSSFSQAIYIDPTTSAAMASHGSIINSQLNRTNDNLTLIQRGQLAVTGQLTIVNDLQSQIYRGLSEVSAVVRNLLAVRDIAEISMDIASDANKALQIAGSNPVLLLFAEGGAREFKNRSIALAAEVSSFVLAGGINNLMDSGERARLLGRIVTELTILRGVAYGMHRSMYWAKQRGILNSLNPYSGFMNMDKRIADDIIRTAKYLKQ
ncbi:hypothetical protein DU508_21660 [Pedobacter chinensis]|uniref:Plasmid transfer protein n=1 Tax=Pedobacter chinensis TaxID=2282421 RepID=A0A369PNZ8_9SPHI|nr:hypothetical protein [Pedobacter chinensis]RDC54331.1 hypothetical protein DU508_21660 [Pedobacter chinensis]